MPTNAATTTAQLLSIYDLAKRLGCSHVAVDKAIERLGIKPDQVPVSGQRYFSENVLQILREKMRKNGNHK